MRQLSLLCGAVVLAGCLEHRASTEPRGVAPRTGAGPGAPVTMPVAAPAPVAAAAPAAVAAPPGARATAAGPSVFLATVRPRLAERCAPCHNPGGRMYERMPFDEPRVLREHQKGLLRRLKGEDLEVFQRWLTTSEGS